MTVHNPNLDVEGGESTEDESFDVAIVFEILGFIWRAGLRRPLLAIGVFVVVATAGVSVATNIPKIYNAQVKLLVQRDLVTPALSNPGAIRHEADNPARNVSDMIMRRDNLVALVKETNLVDRWAASRPWGSRWKDRVYEALGAVQPSDEDRVTMLAQTLEKRLVVTSDESTLTISVDWQDPHIAYELVTLVQKNFIESRYDAAVTAIQDAIEVLEGHAKVEGEQVDRDLAAYQATIDAQNAPALAPPPPSDEPKSLPVAAVSPTSTRASAAPPDPDLQRALEEKQRQIRVLEEQSDRELESLKQQLLQAQLTLTAQHPTVIALQQRLDTLSKGSPELLMLKSEERALLAQMAVASALSTSAAPAVRFGAPHVLPPASDKGDKFRVEDPRSATARVQLESSMRRYQDVIARLDSARLELDITRTTYQYRYSVITPAEVPRGPKKRTSFMVGVGSVVAGLLLGFLVAAGADFKSGLLLETWQVRRRLKLDVLSELDLPL
jgi:uncharacterized protein involved in exopolysaccharide biosynthesis